MYITLHRERNLSPAPDLYLIIGEHALRPLTNQIRDGLLTSPETDVDICAWKKT